MGNNYTVVNHPQIINERLNRLPFGITILLLYILGIVGNSIVLHIFRKIQQDSTYKTFVFVLALLDLLTSVAHFCKEVATLVYTTYDDGEVECKITYFCGFIVGSSSYFVVFVIAVERYRRICNPLKPQMSVSTSKRVCMGCLSISVVTGIPFLFMMGNWYAKMDGQTVVQCLLGNRGDPKVWPFIYCLWYLVMAVIFYVIIGFIQILIWRRILAHQSSRRKLTDGQNSRHENRSAACAESHNKNDNSKPISTNSEATHSEPNKSIQREGWITYQNDANKGGKFTTEKPSKDSQNTGRSEEDNIKITLTFCIITVLLMVSYTPHLAFNTYIAYQNYYDPQLNIDRSTFTLYSLLQHFVAINGILNPFVYFFNDQRFRNLVRDLMC